MVILYNKILFTTSMWINKLKDLFLNALFPIKCLDCHQWGEVICQSCLDKIIILNQWKPNLYYLDKIVIIFDYRQDLVKKAIKSFKYPPYHQAVLKRFSLLFIQCLKQSSPALNYLTKNNFVLVPVPLSGRKLAQRGFNQAELIAKELADEFNWVLNLKVLKKIKNNPSQTNLSYEQRKLNVQNVFKIQEKCPANVILIDDILTTGATLSQAAKTLRQAGAKKIWAIVLAQG